MVDLLYFKVIGVEKSASHADMRRMLIYHVRLLCIYIKGYIPKSRSKALAIREPILISPIILL
jgi:hypothetical protein